MSEEDARGVLVGGGRASWRSRKRHCGQGEKEPEVQNGAESADHRPDGVSEAIGIRPPERNKGGDSGLVTVA